MTRIAPVSSALATGSTKEILDLIERHAGTVPAAVQVLAASPAALSAWWEFERALAGGSLRRGLREQLAVLTAAANGCRSCEVLHADAARRAGVDPADVDRARHARATDPFAQAALELARAALATVGDVTDDELARARAAGITDAQVLEILAVVAINTFNNACNRLARTPVDAHGPTWPRRSAPIQPLTRDQ